MSFVYFIISGLVYLITKKWFLAFLVYIGLNALRPFDNSKSIHSRRSNSNIDLPKYLTILTSIILNADGKVKKSELDFVKQYYIKIFGHQVAQKYILLLREDLEKDYKLQTVLNQISEFGISDKVNILYYLIGVASADGQISNREMEVLRQIKNYFRIPDHTFISLLAMYDQESYNRNDYNNYNHFQRPVNNSRYYHILELEKTANNEEIKAKYKQMVKKYHPDKSKHLGEEFHKSSQEKFLKIQEAYEIIRNDRGI